MISIQNAPGSLMCVSQVHDNY